MIRYILKRLLWMIPTVVGVVILVFTLLYFTPGDPAEVIAGDTATPEQIEETRIQLGLDKPYIEQLAEYLENIVVHQDFGTSYLDHSDAKVRVAACRAALVIDTEYMRTRVRHQLAVEQDAEAKKEIQEALNSVKEARV